MTIADAMNKIRVMLAEEVVKTTEEVKMAEATLVDGTVVMTEGELVEGAVLYVQVSEGEAPFAPAGMHETVDGLLVTVGENGIIEKIEEKAADAAAEEVVVVEASSTFNSEELLKAIAEMIKAYQEEVEAISTEMTSLQERFNAVAGEPAAKPVKHNFGADAKSAREQELSRFERLLSLKNKK